MKTMRTDILNYLIKKYDYKSYLEIGAARGKNFAKIEIENKDDVEPKSNNVRYKMGSNEFFTNNKKIYDLIFIDGLHLEEQTLKDIKNALACLSENGIIVVHDCNPTKEEFQVEKQERTSIWTGTVWKAIARLRMTRKNLEMYVVDTDYGCGIIRRGQQKVFPFQKKLNWEFLEKNRKKLLNLINVEKFKEIF